MAAPQRILIQTTIPSIADDWHVGRFSLLARFLRDLQGEDGADCLADVRQQLHVISLVRVELGVLVHDSVDLLIRHLCRLRGLMVNAFGRLIRHDVCCIKQADALRPCRCAFAGPILQAVVV